MKKVAINWDELSAAFDNSFPELSYYLDTETGEVILITEEAHRFVQELYEGEDDVDAPDFDLDAVLARSNMPLWQQENIRQAVFVEAYFGGRVIEIPRTTSFEGYEEMQDFIVTVQDDQVADQLQNAIQGRGAFRRFRDVLKRYQAEEQRWYDFQEERQTERIREWLEEEDIEPAEA